LFKRRARIARRFGQAFSANDERIGRKTRFSGLSPIMTEPAMPKIQYEGNRFDLGENQSVLECLLEQGVQVPNACRAGACQTCLMHAVSGQPPAEAQRGLKPSLKLRDYFLSCLCKPAQDLTVAFPDEAQTAIHATVRKLELLSEEIMLVELECDEPMDYRAGQFINLVHNHSHIRSYSLASAPGLDKHLQLHVRRLPQGRVSGWIHDELQIGHRVEIRGPAGDCFYIPGAPDKPMLFIGTGSGLGPLYGILRDALRQGHAGPLRLFHGSRDLRGLYLVDELRELAKNYPNFIYTPCLSSGHPSSEFAAGRAHEIAFREIPNLKAWRVYLCGHPEMVKVAQKKAFLAGASLQEIHADAFNLSQT
jgi:ferredoxin-NADP reductase/ferredoxin